MDADFVREIYKRELDEKLALDTRPTFHALAFSSVAAVIAIAHGTVPSEPYWVQVLWVVCIAVAIGGFAWAFWLVLRYTTGFEYEKLAVASLLREHHQSLQAYFDDNPLDTTNVADAFAADMTNRMVDAATANALVNAQRGELHVRIIRALVISTVAAGLPPLLCESRKCLDSIGVTNKHTGGADGKKETHSGSPTAGNALQQRSPTTAD
jgi:hypothetical protein